MLAGIKRFLILINFCQSVMIRYERSQNKTRVNSIILWYVHYTMHLYKSLNQCVVLAQSPKFLPLRESSLLAKELHHQIDRQREDICVVVLGRDGVEGLQVAQLEGGRGLVNDVSRLTQLLGGTPLTIGRYHLICEL